MRKAIRIFDLILFAVCVALFMLIGVGNAVTPDTIVTYGEEKTVFNSIYTCSVDKKDTSVDFQNSSSRQSIKVLGVVPVKTVSVTSKQEQRVYVSGESFGIKLYTDGVIVVGTQSVDLGSKKVNPAENAGIEVGDIIISINNMNVFTSDDVEKILNDNNGKPYTVKVKRNERYKTFTLTPVYSDREGCYKAGMWVRDSTAGIGTITFYNKEAGTFGALGHQVNDVDTNEIMPMLEGEAVGANVTKVYKAASGETGSLTCDFQDYTIGRLTDNTYCGIYGVYSQIGESAKEYTVSSKQEVEKGEAELITTVDSSGPHSYDIEITKISYSESHQQKNMVIKITDRELLEKTGGIVQGMSGSPIIQNGKLVGALTHVIINNPKKGYAIFAQTMVEQSNFVE